MEDRLAPAVFTVSNTNDAGDGSLRAAITALNGSADTSNTIVFMKQGPLTGTITLESALDPIKKNVTIAGSGTSNLTISRDPNAATKFSIFSVNANTNVSISGLTIADGNTTGNGGGIDNEGGTVNLNNDDLTGNEAGGRGGALYNAQGGTMVLSGVYVWLNTADLDGGGIASYGSLSINANSNIFANNASNGGGVLNDGTMSISQSNIYSNTALADGGGIENLGTLSSWNGGRLQLNSAGRDGGGIDDWAGRANLTNVTISNRNSAATAGGGFFVNTGSLTLTSCTLSGNEAPVGAGGAYVQNQGTYTISGGTITDPIAPVQQP